MNKIYRRLWSVTRNCWVVASDLATARGKKSPSKLSVLGAVLMVSMPVLACAATLEGAVQEEGTVDNEAEQWKRQWLGNAMASVFGVHSIEPSERAQLVIRQAAWVTDSGYRDSTLSGDHLLILGSTSFLSGNRSVAYGNRILAVGDNNVALGHGVDINGGYGTAVGAMAVSRGVGATALGNNAKAYTENSIAIGSGSNTNNGAGNARIAIGGNAYAGRGGWTGAIALGGEARADYDGVAIGHAAKTTASGTVALGRGSEATEVNSVSVGNSSTRRRIVNVNDARLNASSTDAVTGKQLYATNQNVSAATAKLTAKALALGEGATAESAAYGISTALGYNAKAYNGQSVALGYDARAGVDASGNKGTSLNAGVSLGARSRSGNGAVAAGLQASALGDRAVAVGNEAAANVTHATAMGYQSAAAGSQSTAIGRGAQSSASYATSLGNLAKATASSALALGDRSVAQHSGSVALGNGAQTTAANQVSVGSNSLKRKIVNVADAALSSTSAEAVTGKQLNATNVAVTSARSVADAAKTAATAAQSTATTALTRATEVSGLVRQETASGDVRLGGENTGTVLDVRNKSNAVRSISGVKEGSLDASSTDVVTGKQLHATNTRMAVLDGLIGQASAGGNLRLGAQNTGTIVDVANKAGAKRRIYNIANGTLSAGSTDAVTGQQLFATNASVEKQRLALAGHAQQLTDHDGRIADNRIELDTLRTEFDNYDPDLEGVVKFSADRRQVDMEGARVSGVAAGDISSATSTDAVNGGQLFATNQKISALEGVGRFIAVGAGGDQEQASAGRFSVAIGDSASASISGEGGVAVGGYAVAGGTNSVAIGRAASVRDGATAGFALGVRSLVEAEGGLAVGAESRVQSGALDSVAIGSRSLASEEFTVSFGHDDLQRRLVNVGRGIRDSDAVTISQLAESVSGLGGGAGLDGNGYFISPTYSVQGSTQNNVGDALAALDGAVVRSDSRVDGLEGQLRATFQQSSSTGVDGVGQLNLAGAQGMVLSNLADGRIAAGSRDAVTGNQLHATEQKIERNRRDLDAMQRDWISDQKNLLTEISDGNLIDFGGARLTGVADARLSADSSDVVRGSQLYSTNLRLSSIEEMGNNFAFGWIPEDWQYPAQAGPAGLAIGKNAKASLHSEGGVAVGAWATAQGKNSVALGRASYVHEQAEDGFAVGGRTQVAARGGIALGAGSEVRSNASNSVAIGYQSIADDADTVSFGNDWLKRRLTGVANGRNANDAATIGQLRGALSALGGNIDANGNVTTPGFNIQGQHQSTVNDALTTLDSAVITTGTRMDRVETQLRSVLQDTPSTRSDGTAQLTLAGANGMVISNVANGLIAAGSREAVNGGQLHAVQQQLNGRMDGLEQRVDGQPQSRALATATATASAAPAP
ncbi:ESPR-type extended signal peptide-containing protein, partial [Stenotrophomonas sp. NPDC077659]|uniref:ESPR-type extended signal peptide-containing protein n=1 Tax=Stenotrophomonas sp. NPDC077659 TaxID=3390694 RepID=UPI003D03ED81